jgi:hypothetical protein
VREQANSTTPPALDGYRKKEGSPERTPYADSGKVPACGRSEGIILNENAGTAV